jgi:hypothetical protein
MQVVCGGSQVRQDPLDTQRFTSSLAATPRRAKVWFSSSPSVIVFHSDLSPYELGRVVRHLKPIKLACHLARWPHPILRRPIPRGASWRERDCLPSGIVYFPVPSQSVQPDIPAKSRSRPARATMVRSSLNGVTENSSQPVKKRR